MSRIEHKVKLCSKGICKEETALFDADSDLTYISPKLADEMKVKYTGFEFETEVANKGKLHVREAEIDELKVLGCRRIKPRIMVADVGRNIIVGNDIMLLLGITLDPKKHKLKINKCKGPILY